MSKPKQSKKRKDGFVNIDGKDYEWEKLKDEEKFYFNHVLDLDNKLASAKFNVDQMAGGREYWMGLLTKSLNGEVDGPTETKDSKEL